MTAMLITFLYMALGMVAARNAGQTMHQKMLGLTMVWSCAVSNIAYWTLPLDSRIFVNALLDVCVFSAAGLCFRDDGSRWFRALMVLAVASAVVSFSFAYFRFMHPIVTDPDAKVAEYRYGAVLNLIYVLQCFTIIWRGRVDASRNADYYRLDRVRSRTGISTFRTAGQKRPV